MTLVTLVILGWVFAIANLWLATIRENVFWPVNLLVGTFVLFQSIRATIELREGDNDE